MQTIKEIEHRIQTIQTRIDAANQAAQQERDKSELSRRYGETAQAQAHSDTAMKHEQQALLMQDEIATLMKDEQQLQAQLTELDRKKETLVKTKDDELSQLEGASARIRGE